MGMLGHWVGGGGNTQTITIYKTLNETSYVLLPKFLSKINSACAITLDPFVGFVYVVDKSVPVYLKKKKKKLSTYHCKLFESAYGDTKLKMGRVVKKSVLSLLTALISAKMHSCSKLIYFAINIY